MQLEYKRLYILEILTLLTQQAEPPLNIVVYQNTDERSRMAKKLLKYFGRGYENVPVYTGYGQTLENSIKKFRHIVQYTPELERPEYIPDEEEPERAIDFLIESAKKYGEDLTIVAIGPFTNIARAIQKQPKAEFSRLCRH